MWLVKMTVRLVLTLVMLVVMMVVLLDSRNQDAPLLHQQLILQLLQLLPHPSKLLLLLLLRLSLLVSFQATSLVKDDSTSTNTYTGNPMLRNRITTIKTVKRMSTTTSNEYDGFSRFPDGIKALTCIMISLVPPYS